MQSKATQSKVTQSKATQAVGTRVASCDCGDGGDNNKVAGAFLSGVKEVKGLRRPEGGRCFPVRGASEFKLPRRVL